MSSSSGPSHAPTKKKEDLGLEESHDIADVHVYHTHLRQGALTSSFTANVQRTVVLQAPSLLGFPLYALSGADRKNLVASKVLSPLADLKFVVTLVQTTARDKGKRANGREA
jgi:hypothetical protein